jgi:sugar O-acyltransferase (sialic acid O-acetyltransferase NeuD family)
VRSLLIVGAGGHGKVIADVARAAGFTVVGFVDADPRKLDAVVGASGDRVLAEQAALLRALTQQQPLPGGADGLALGIGDNSDRLWVARQAGPDRFAVILHPAAVVSSSAQIGTGTVVLPAAVINADAVIGSAVIVNTAAVVEHDCIIGDGAHISPGAVLGGGVAVGAGSWIGAGAVVIEGVAVGENVIVGAGAVVLRNVPDGLKVVGVPAAALT